MKYRIIKPKWALYVHELQVSDWFWGWKTVFSSTLEGCKEKLNQLEKTGLRLDRDGNTIFMEKEL